MAVAGTTVAAIMAAIIMAVVAAIMGGTTAVVITAVTIMAEAITAAVIMMDTTAVNEMGRWNPDAIERQLAHQEANAVRRAYTHNVGFWSERVLMMQAWGDFLDGLRQGGKVIPLITGALERR